MTRKKQPVYLRLGQAALIVLFLPLIIPLAVIGLALFWLNRLLVYLLIWTLWLPKGKDALVIYSDSPIWREYMTQQVLPLLNERAAVLNWSERSTWGRWSFTVHVFKSFSGGREFNPMVMLFRPFRPARQFRFLSAFQEWKHGRPDAVERLRRDLIASL